MDRLLRAIQVNAEGLQQRQSIIKDLFNNLKIKNPNQTKEWMYEQYKYLESKTDIELQNM